MLSELLGAYGRWLIKGKRAWGVLAFVAVLSVAAGGVTQGLETEDDLLAFLPEGNLLIDEFESINTDFGGLDVALVGIEVDDVFQPGFLRPLDDLSSRIQEMDSVSHVLSLSTVTDIAPGEGGASFAYTRLVPEIPEGEREIEALRSRVMARDLVVGQLVSEDQTSVLLYAFATPDAEPRALAGELEGLVNTHFPDAQVHLGGAALVSTYIYDTTQADMSRLTPWAVGTIVLLMFLAFRDVKGTVLALVSTGLGILFSHAAMTVCGVSLNVVLSSMPIILFAVGSAYSIHVLARYQCHARTGDRSEALLQTLKSTGPTVVISGCTTAIGLLSFVLMDIGPLRTFGVFTSIGILSTLVLSLTLVPAFIHVARIPGRETLQGIGARGGVQWARVMFQRRRWIRPPVVLALCVSVVFIGEVDTRVDQSAFYADDSPPARADQFMNSRFGGSQFIQVRVRGDLGEPEVLREIQRISDTIRRIPGVSRVSHVGDALALGNGMMDGWTRIPDTREQVGNLMELVLSGERALGQLITEDRAQALIQIQIQSAGPDESERILSAVEGTVRDEALKQIVVVRVDEEGEADIMLRDRVARRLQAISEDAGLSSSPEPATVAAGLSGLERGTNVAVYEEALQAILLGADAEDFIGEALPVSVAATISHRVAQKTDWGEGPDALIDAVGAVEIGGGGTLDPLTGELVGMFLFSNLDGPLQTAQAGDARGVARLLDVTLPESALGDRVSSRWVSALQDLSAPTAAAQSASGMPLDWTVSGLPMMHRGLSESVEKNQWRSLLSALILVAALLSLAFRSLRAGLLATAPMAAALVFIYGGMGLFGIRLDIGTSMLASLVIGAGVDYAVHFLSSWRRLEGEGPERAPCRAAARTGPAIWTNALMVASGFFVLTLGDARPLQNVGGLTASAMLLAAATTFVLIPILGSRREYTQSDSEDDPADCLIDSVPST